MIEINRFDLLLVVLSAAILGFSIGLWLSNDGGEAGIEALTVLVPLFLMGWVQLRARGRREITNG